jgi:hypothetical protein
MLLGPLPQPVSASPLMKRRKHAPEREEFKVAEPEKGLADRHRVPDRLVCSLRIAVEGGSVLRGNHRPAMPGFASVAHVRHGSKRETDRSHHARRSRADFDR